MRPATGSATLSIGWQVGLAALGAVAAVLWMPGAAANQDPVAVAGSDSVLAAVEPFVLNGSASHDPDGDNITCDWGWSRDPAGHFENRTLCTTTFFPEGSGIFHFRLTVRDPTGINYTLDNPDSLPPPAGYGYGVAIDHMTVSVDNHSPDITYSTPAAGDVFAVEGFTSGGPGYNTAARAVVGLNAHASDPDAGNLTWLCFADGGIVTSEVSDVGGNGVCLLFAAAGTYRVRAVVTDGAFNDSIEWVVHIAPYVDPRRTADEAILVTMLLAPAVLAAVAAVLWKIRLRRGH